MNNLIDCMKGLNYLPDFRDILSTASQPAI